MSDSLGDLLANRDYDEPPEIRAIKRYIHDEFDADAEVMIRERDITITVTSAPLANNLRLRLTQLKRVAATDKRLIFRIR